MNPTVLPNLINITQFTEFTIFFYFFLYYRAKFLPDFQPTDEMVTNTNNTTEEQVEISTSPSEQRQPPTLPPTPEEAHKIISDLLPK